MARKAKADAWVDQGMVRADMVRVLEKPAFYPAVDAHVHIVPTAKSYEIAIRVMDAAGVATSVNLWGFNGKILAQHVKLATKYPGRFVQYCHINAKEVDWKAKDLGERFARIIRESKDMGAIGFGELVGWDHEKPLIAWDDERLEPMWSTLEELAMPVNWHVSSPSRYWRPRGPLNMTEGPSRLGKGPLKFELLMQQELVMARHPRLVVLAAHSNFLADMVPLAVYRLENYPNYHLELSASLEEWGRVPEDFLFMCNQYKDRLLYGSDAFYADARIADDGSLEKHVAHHKAFQIAQYLFLGTSQKTLACPYNGNYGGRIVGWHNDFPLYANDGVALPADILKRIYYKNADRLIGTKAAGWKPAKPVDFSDIH